MRFLAALSLILVASCSSRVQQTIKDPQGPNWLEDGLYDAAEFWEETESVDVLIGDDGAVKVSVETLLPTYLGMFQGDGVGGGSIQIDPSGQDSAQKAKCILAHEIGHSLNSTGGIGMDHVEGSQSLMFPSLHLPADGYSCFWSQTDRAEFCRATGHDCGGESGVMSPQSTAEAEVAEDEGNL